MVLDFVVDGCNGSLIDSWLCWVIFVGSVVYWNFL